MLSRMHVQKYVPEHLFGFVAQGDREIYFHLRSFDYGEWETPPPIIGEEVEVDWDPEAEVEDRAPRARSVRRLKAPVERFGTVETFNDKSGYGFIATPEGSAYLHRSEVLHGRLPMPGQAVRFYEGRRQDRVRAVYVEIQDR